MSRTVVVTGASGFVGRHLSAFLCELGGDLQVIGVDNRADQAIHCHGFRAIDLLHQDAVAALMAEFKPEAVFHLAGMFGSGTTVETCRVNVLSTIGLLEAVRESCPDAVVVSTGSSAEYGNVERSQLPVVEAHPSRPVTPYGLSKQLSSDAALHYQRVHGLKVVVARPFQLIGKGVSNRLAPGAFAEKLAAAQASGQTVMTVGNLESYRDFVDVRDAVDALWKMSRTPSPGEIYNVCSSAPVKMGDLLALMIEVSGAAVTIDSRPGLIGPKTDVPMLYGSYEKLHLHTGWKPTTSLLDSVCSMFAK